jgi:hypothetical protein
MFASPYRRWTPALALAAGLAGCAGQQTGPGQPLPQTGASQPLPHTASSMLARFSANPAQFGARHQNHRGSWIKPEGRPFPLLYVSDSFAHAVDVYTYPNLKYVGQLTGFGFPMGECTDKAGNVWITDASGAVYKYAHGGTNPIETLLNDMDHPNGCAVDPRNGDLAVGNGNAQVLVFHTGSSSPTVYTDSNFSQTMFLSYDNQDNLFVDGTDTSNIFHYAELPAGSQTFSDINLNYGTFPMIQSPGGVKWDGTYMAVGDSQWTIYQTQGSNVISTTTLSATCVFTFDIFRSRRAPLVAPDQCTGGGVVGTYAYPAGGSPIKLITSGLITPYGAAVSR